MMSLGAKLNDDALSEDKRTVENKLNSASLICLLMCRTTSSKHGAMA